MCITKCGQLSAWFSREAREAVGRWSEQKTSGIIRNPWLLLIRSEQHFWEQDWARARKRKRSLQQPTERQILCFCVCPLCFVVRLKKMGGCSFFLQSISVNLVFLSAKLIYYWLPSISFQAVSPGFGSKPNSGKVGIWIVGRPTLKKVCSFLGGPRYPYKWFLRSYISRTILSVHFLHIHSLCSVDTLLLYGVHFTDRNGGGWTPWKPQGSDWWKLVF